MKGSKISIRSLFGILAIGFACSFPAAVWGQDTIQKDTTEEPSVGFREDFSDDELKSFVKANEKVMAIQMEGEQKMIKAIEDEGLTLDRFNKILEEQRDPQRGTETSPEELQSFNNAAQIILEENAKIEEAMSTSIEKEGIDISTYKQIMVAYQQSPTLQSRVNKMVNEKN